jgi:hypothetical protein
MRGGTMKELAVRLWSMTVICRESAALVTPEKTNSSFQTGSRVLERCLVWKTIMSTRALTKGSEEARPKRLESMAGKPLPATQSTWSSLGIASRYSSAGPIEKRGSREASVAMKTGEMVPSTPISPGGGPLNRRVRWT